MRTLSRILVCASAVGLLLAVATPAWAPEAPNPGFEQGWRSGEADAQRRHELELQRRQFEYERRLNLERAEREHELQTSRREPSRDQKFNATIEACARQTGVRAYTWDEPNGRAASMWYGTKETGRAFNECLDARASR